MSFGKDSGHLAGMPVYGGSYTQRAANAGRKKNRNYGNRRPYWSDGFKPHETLVSSVRLIPGDYEITRVDDRDQLITEKTAWYEFVDHYSGTHRRGGICSGGPFFFNKSKRTTCYGCDKREAEGGRGKNVKKSMSRSDKFVFVVIDMGLFHQVPQVERDTGRVRMNPKNNEPYLEWVKCGQRGCQNCHVALQSRYGYIQPWTMPKQHFNALNSYAPGIGTCCVSCGGRGTIQSIAWLCGNPQCRQAIFDMKTTTATDEQIAQVVNEPYGCRFCQQTCYPEEVIYCTNCSPYQRQPVRATIFDVDLQIKAPKTGENDNTNLQVVGMSDPKPLDPQFQDLLQYKPDLKKKFSPSSLEEQQSLWPDSAQTPQLGALPPGQPGGYLQPPGAPATYAQPYGQAPVQHPVAPQPQYAQPGVPAPVVHVYPQPQYQPPAPVYGQPPQYQAPVGQGPYPQPAPVQYAQPMQYAPPSAPQPGYPQHQPGYPTPRTGDDIPF
jgi:hypothetical protein